MVIDVGQPLTVQDCNPKKNKRKRPKAVEPQERVESLDANDDVQIIAEAGCVNGFNLDARTTKLLRSIRRVLCVFISQDIAAPLQRARTRPSCNGSI